MFLKKLEIQGFKSFYEKVSLDFKEGITAIVGPNGSGKSNISDAIRWVLGEQSAKTLRGEKMEDIIFSGTKNRKQLGFAQVSIFLDNFDKKYGLDFNEIVVTRKAYRSGESGYFINGASCRLKDIHELFMDTGIGKEGYSIIGQGKIDAILSNKIEERRGLFEEAVGIVKFKNRKIQSEQKLDEIRKNLIRTNDIIYELEKQIKPLELQAHKAKEYLLIYEEQKLIKINIFISDYNKFQKEIKKAENDLNILTQNITELEDEKIKFEALQSDNKINLTKIEQKLKSSNLNLLKIKEDIEKQEMEVKLNIKSIDFIKSDLDRIEIEKTSFEKYIIKTEEEIKILNTSLEAKKLKYFSKQKSLDLMIKEFEEFKQKLYKDEEKIKNFNNNILEKVNIYSEKANKLNLIKNSKIQYEERRNQLKTEENLFKSKINERIIRKRALEKSIYEKESCEKLLTDFIDEKNAEMQNLNTEILNLRQKYSLKNKSYIEIKNKEKILTQFEKEYEGYFNSVKSILKESKRNTELSGICGAIGELITVPRDYEIAIEIALGTAVQNIITNTEEDAKLAIEYLKNLSKGRATFWPISSVKPRNIENNINLKNEKGFIGIAVDVVSFENKFYNIISNLLGRVVIIDNIDNAVLFSKKYRYLYKIITLSGEIINTNGALTGGSILKKETGIFTRGRELKEIGQKIIDLNREINKITNTIEIKENTKKDIALKIKEEEENLKFIFEEKVIIKSDIFQNEQYLKELNEKIENLEIEENALKNNLDLNLKNITALQKEIQNIESETEMIKKNLSDFENYLEQDKIDKDFKFSEISNFRISVNSLKNEIENKNNEILKLNLKMKADREKEEKLKEEILKKLKEEENINEAIILTDLKILDLKDKHKDLQADYDKDCNLKIKIAEKTEQYSSKILEITTNIGIITNQRTKIYAKIESNNESLDRICDYIWEEYKITFAAACNNFERLDITYSNLILKERELKSKIAKLGNINVSAIEDYKIIKERYELNISQREDILKADEDLKQIILTLVKEMEDQFKMQFNIINKNFQEVFSGIFGGGTAKLTLTDENNILKSGIEIIASPPGKNLQNLALLSGGEKALTAISLLFAILKIKASPFCIFDETEAALDDANVIRYANFLKKFAEKNQFILITHKTGTMEIADILYGITMEEQGISKVVSVELKEARHYKKD